MFKNEWGLPETKYSSIELKNEAKMGKDILFDLYGII